MIILENDMEKFLTSWGSWCVPFEWNGHPYCLPSGFENELISRGIEFTVVDDVETFEKLYFSTMDERDAFNAAEAEFAGADPSVPYLETGEDENGYYLLVDVVAKPSLWQRFKNLFG